MKLRTRLFLWIGSLFLLFALISYFLENFLVQRHLEKSKQEIKGEIQKNERKKRCHFEEFLGIIMADFQANIDAVLYRAGEESVLKGRQVTKNSTPSRSFISDLLLENKWIHFIQNKNPQGEFFSIIPSSYVLKTFEAKEINKDLAWVHYEGKIYIGIKVSAKQMQKYLPSLMGFNEVKHEYFLYDPKTLQMLDFTAIHVGKLKGFQKIFFQKLRKGQDYVRENGYEGILFSQKKDTLANGFPEKINPHLSEMAFQEFIRSFENDIETRQIIRQIWIVNSALGPDFFDGSIFGSKAPLAIASSFTKKKSGKGFFIRAVMFDTKLFDDQSYYLKHLPKKGEKIPSSLALINTTKQNQMFLANTLQYSKNGYLSIGINIANMLQRLALATNQHVLLMKDQKVLTVYAPQGNYLPRSIFYRLSSKDLEKEEGETILDGKAYYYLKLRPYKNGDFYFYILDLKSKAFSFVDYISHAMISLISNISFSMRVIAMIGLLIVLILLQNIARKISKPISQLAKMTEPIAEGHYEKVQIPKVPLGPSEEVRTLCDSFSKMVQSLKDKEKVRGVLNKVVSKEIAEEILKGSVHLGGEEKIVTILFADIRNFTRLTEKMSPKEVIELLNLTMTKICQVIDQYKGVVDKFVGDEVMALFGAPIKDDLATLKAIIAAKKIMDELAKLNSERRQEKKVEIHIGIGIHTGVVVAGNMGAENRLNYTVLGSNVNLAARVCSIAKEDEILITENTLQVIQQEKVEVEKLEPVQLKGFTKQITIYRLQKIFADLPSKRTDA